MLPNIKIPFCLRIPGGGGGDLRVEKIFLEVKAYRLQNKHLDTITEHLEKHPYPPKGSLLELMMDQYHRAGWTNPVGRGAQKKEVGGFTLEQPSISFLYYYTLLGISMNPVETFIQRYYPEFSLSQFLIGLSHHYQTPIEKLFPSHRHEIANRLPPEVIRRTTTTTTNDKKKKKKKKDIVQEEEEERGGEIIIEWVEEEHCPVEEIVERKREDANRKERRVKHQKRLFGRILPISLLPLFLSHLPDFYQEVNISLSLCEQAESLLWNSMVLHKYDSYVADQVRLLRENRRHLAMEYQCDRFTNDREIENYENILLENELLQRQICDEECREVDAYCQFLIEEAVKNKRLSVNNGTTGKEGEKETRIRAL